jgi:GntR family transcriptional regulator
VAQVSRDQIDHLSDLPVYVQLADLLRRQITEGQLEPRSPIPSSRTLAQQHGVALGTVKRAVDVLRGEGLVRNVPGRGAFVIGPS